MTPQPVCATQGCDTYTRRGDRYCLACQLDRDVPPPPLAVHRGRPPRETCQVDGCRHAVATYCPLCEQDLCLEHDELVAYRGHRCLSDRRPLAER